jgi:glycosyltransferase involved in cell wall biosynthesis
MLVSIIIPTYNRAATIAVSVASALAQTYQPIEVIVVDDGSDDDTASALSDYADRIRLIRQKNAGPSAARNRGVAESRGDIIAFLDSDDAWLPDKIRRQVELMEQAGADMTCCVCNAEIRGIDGKITGSSFEAAGLNPAVKRGRWLNPSEFLATGFLLFNQVVAVRRTAFNAVGGFDPKLRLLEDHELALRLSATGEWGILTEPLVIKRNDTGGIGVECLKDHVKHLETCVGVISAFLERDRSLPGRAISMLRDTLEDLQTALRAARLTASGTFIGRLRGHLLASRLKVSKTIRRRLPSWPTADVRPI